MYYIIMEISLSICYMCTLPVTAILIVIFITVFFFCFISLIYITSSPRKLFQLHTFSSLLAINSMVVI